MNERIYAPKEIKRFTKENNCGIYQIKNKVNGKIYVGSSKTLDRRKTQHFSDLKNQKHSNKYLQCSYNKYGKGNFIFEVIEFCPEDKRIELEQYWVNTLDAFAKGNKGYNISDIVDQPKTFCGAENKKSKKVIHVNTGEIYEAIRIAAEKTGISYGAIRSSCRLRGVMKDGNVFRYLEEYETMSEEQKISLLKERNITKSVVCVETSQVFESICEASRALNINKGNISNCCLHKRNSLDGFHFLFKDEYDKTSKKYLDLLVKKENGLKPIIDIYTNKLYKNKTECALNNNLNIKTVYNHCYGNVKKTRFLFYEDYLRKSEEELYNLKNKEIIKKKPNGTKVVCLETGKIYNKILEATKDTGCNSTSISCCCRGLTVRTTKGKKLHWVYYKDFVKMTNEDIQKKIKETKEYRKCVCIETNQAFSSLTEAAKVLGVSSSKIAAVCRGKRKSTGGYHFKYVN